MARVPVDRPAPTIGWPLPHPGLSLARHSWVATCSVVPTPVTCPMAGARGEGWCLWVGGTPPLPLRRVSLLVCVRCALSGARCVCVHLPSAVPVARQAHAALEASSLSPSSMLADAAHMLR
jgi:hypothetical protein